MYFAFSIMIQDVIHESRTGMTTSVAVGAVLGFLMLLGILTQRSITSKGTLPGVPKLKGYSIFGAIPIYFKQGAPQLLQGLIAIGGDGISYAKIGNEVLVSIHDPAIVREVLSFPDEIASREGDTTRMSWSPFFSLVRLIGDSLFNYVGPKINHPRILFTREFNSQKSNAEKFDDIVKIATTHTDEMIGDAQTTVIKDIRHYADNFAISLWGDILYGNPDNHVSGLVLRTSDRMLHMSGSPWPNIWYYFQLCLCLVRRGQPTHSEGKLRTKMDQIVTENITKMEEFERSNPDAPLKTMRNFSVMSGGGKTGPLSQIAIDFANLNIFGGHHSIGSIVTWALIELDRHPESLAKLLTEISVVDTTKFKDVDSRMPYLDALIWEILRLYPVVHATVRVMNREARLASSKIPVTLAPRMLLYISFLHLQTSPKYWGPTAGEFNPDRFLDGKSKDLPFMPFGYGSRNCVGYKFTLLATKVYFIMLLQKYKMSLMEHDLELKICTLIETSKPVAMNVTRCC